MTEASLTRALASRGIDAPLRSGRPQVAREVQVQLSRSADAMGLGIAILGVNLSDARPPSEVEPAFAEAQSAQAERDRRIVEAKALAPSMRPAALARAGARTDEANARASRSAEIARAQAGRFLALLAEADRSRPLTVRRLYRDALQEASAEGPTEGPDDPRRAGRPGALRLREGRSMTPRRPILTALPVVEVAPGAATPEVRRRERLGQPDRLAGGDVVEPGPGPSKNPQAPTPGQDLATAPALGGVGPGLGVFPEVEKCREDPRHVGPVIRVVGLDDEKPRPV